MRITTSYRLGGTKSMRRAAGSLFGIFGTNLQNPSKTLMSCCVPDPGYVFLQADQSGAEARYVAMETEPGYYRELFDCGIKPHQYLALQIFMDLFLELMIKKEIGHFGKDRYWLIRPRELAALPEWKALKKLIAESGNPYALGKLTAHAKSYDMGPFTFQSNVLEKSGGTIRLTIAEARRYLAMFETLFPEVIEWQRKIKAKILADRELRNAQGFPRQFHGRWSPGMVREAYSFEPQSTIGIITSNAVCDMVYYAEDNGRDWDVLNDKHDSILMQVPRADAIEAGTMLQDKLSATLTSSRGETWRMGTELFAGTNWRDMIEFEKCVQDGRFILN